MSRHHQFTAIATTGALLHVAGELRHELKVDIEDLRKSQDNAVTNLQNNVADLRDDIKTIKEQLLLLTRKIDDSGDSSQSFPPSEQGCSRDISDVTVSVEDNEMELRNQTSTQSESYLLKIIKLDR